MQQRLIEVVRAHLFRISELSNATAEALVNGGQNAAAELDRQAELEIGAKERPWAH